MDDIDYVFRIADNFRPKALRKSLPQCIASSTIVLKLSSHKFLSKSIFSFTIYIYELVILYWLVTMFQLLIIEAEILIFLLHYTSFLHSGFLTTFP